MLGPLEVFDRECVDGNDLDAGFIADFKNLPPFCEYGVFFFVLYSLFTDLRQCLKSHVVSFHCFDVVLAREPSVAVHDEGDMLRHGPLPDRVYEELL